MPKHSREKQVEVLTAFQLNGGNVKRTARETKVDRATVRAWVEVAKQERLALTTSPHKDDTPVAVSGEIVAAPSSDLLPYTPEPTEPLWYEVETNTLAIVQQKVAALRKVDGDYTVQELKQLAQIAQIAHTIRTGQDRLGVGNTTVQVAVVWERAPRPGDTLPHERRE